jgi:TM2 domain-containing membrane protein YozV
MLPVIAVKSKQTAAILAFVLGWAGVHRFYLGYVTLGIVQLVLAVFFGLCTYGLAFLAALVWGIVEGALILNGTINRDADGRPLKE